MDLLLWRHADALDAAPDISRGLSRRGHEQARKIGAWLSAHVPANLLAVVSPSVRTRETFACLKADDCEVSHYLPLYEGAKVEDILDYIGWPDATRPVLVVGHQPLLGDIAATILTPGVFPGAFRKGNLVWVRSSSSRDSTTDNELLYWVEPEEV